MERHMHRGFIGIQEDEWQNNGGFNRVRSNLRIPTTNAAADG